MTEWVLPPPYPCPCCGYFTFHENPPCTYLVCPICFWEDRAGPMPLRMAQRNFVAFGACDRQWLHQVRSPTGSDRRIPDWQPLDQLAEAAKPAVMQQILTAFADVAREDGVTLHEAMENERWGGPFHPRPEARQYDTDTCWQDIPDEWLETLYMGCHYLDLKGWRYYSPAFMLYTLRNYLTSTSAAIDWTIGQFTVPEREPFRMQRLSDFGYLTREQSQAVCQFLRFIARYGDPYADAHRAQTALNAYWERFCS